MRDRIQSGILVINAHAALELPESVVIKQLQLSRRTTGVILERGDHVHFCEEFIDEYALLVRKLGLFRFVLGFVLFFAALLFVR